MEYPNGRLEVFWQCESDGSQHEKDMHLIAREVAVIQAKLIISDTPVIEGKVTHK
jgi:hypothetical protein